MLCREEKPEEPEAPKYRDRAKERREDQNPDYEPTELGSFHAVAPPGTADIRYEYPTPEKTNIFFLFFIEGSYKFAFFKAVIE